MIACEDFNHSWESWQDSFKIFKLIEQVFMWPHYGKLNRKCQNDLYTIIYKFLNIIFIEKY